MSLMCHEVRTPLNGCLASAEMLLETSLEVGGGKPATAMTCMIPHTHAHARLPPPGLAPSLTECSPVFPPPPHPPSPLLPPCASLGGAA